MVNFKEDEYLNKLNHSCAHMMAQAVKHLMPDAKFWVGPVIETGFYYDMDLGDRVINDEDIATLITCTPYGINTQRLIVNGKRIPYSIKVQESIPEEMMSLRELFFTVLPFLFLFLLLIKEFKERRKA